MKTISKLVVLIIAFISLALTGTALHAQADKSTMGDLAMITELPVSISSEQVGNALESAFKGRKWTVVENKDGVIRATLDHRRINSKITAIYTEGKIKYYSDTTKSKQVYDNRVNKTVTVVTQVSVVGWLRNIEKEVKRQLGLLK